MRDGFDANPATLRGRAQAGESLFGTLVASPTPKLVDQLASAGLDFVFIDTEHVPLGRESLAWMCCGYRHAGLPPLVRVPRCDASELRFVIELGAAGVVAPYIETREQVETLCDAVRRRPLQGEVLRRFAADAASSGEALRDYIARRTADTLLLLNIESGPAIDRIDELLGFEGVDGVLVGPHDLSCNLGRPEQYEHPAYTDALRHIVEAARRRGKTAAMHFMGCGELDLAASWRAMGFSMWVQHADVYYAARGVAEHVARLRGETDASTDVKVVI